MWIRLKSAWRSGDVPFTHGGVVRQAWRGGPRQGVLARALAGVDIRHLDGRLGRAAGELLGRAGLSDVIDATLVLVSTDGDDIATSDHDDIARLAAAAGRHVELIHP